MRSQYRGNVDISTNYEVFRNAPLDARMLAGTKADLTDPTQWESPITMYAGMIVAVVQDPAEENNGIYVLKKIPFTIESNWTKLASLDEFSGFQEQIEADLTNYVSKEEAVEFVKMVIVDEGTPINEAVPVPEEKTLYFQKQDGNLYEYISYNGVLTVIGSNSGTTPIDAYTKQEADDRFALKTDLQGFITNTVDDLVNYYTKSEVQSLLENYVAENEFETALAGKQNTLVSGTNIKTINGYSILGEGNIQIQGGSGGDISIATEDTVGGILATDNSTVEGVEAFVDVDDTGKASVKIPSIDETSTPEDVVNLLNTGTLILNGNA